MSFFMGKEFIFGKCRLCHQDTRLVDSHIVPDFHFKSLRRKDGFFYNVSSDPKRKDKKVQKGITEHLLCAICDNDRLQRNENHLARVLFGGHVLNTKRTDRFIIVIPPVS